MNLTLTILSIIKSKGGQLLLALLLGMALTAGIYKHYEHATIQTTERVVHDVREVLVEKPVIQEKVITQLIKDPSQLAATKVALAENTALRTQVESLTTAKATIDTPAKVTIVSTTGKDDSGQFIGTIKLFKDTPLGLVEIPTTNRVVVFADTRVPRWRVSPRLQAGVEFDRNKTAYGVVAFQWLKHGKSTAAEDTRFALLSPALEIEPGKDVGLTILPVSFNLGSIPHVPFTNLWVSPSISRSKHIGVVLSATF